MTVPARRSIVHTMSSHASLGAGPPPIAPMEPSAAACGDADAEPAIRFPQGLPGFPLASRFRLVSLAPASGLLQLISGDDPDLRFLVLVHAEGRLPLAAEDLAEARSVLGMADASTVILLVVTAHAATPAAPCRLFVNLRAPIFLDTAQAMAVQHVLPCASYPIRHAL